MKELGKGILLSIIILILLTQDVSALAFQPQGTCTCNSMDIRTSGWSRWYGTIQKGLGPILGPQPYPGNAYFRYEIEANIAGDDLSACTVYQGIQDTWHANGNTYQQYGPAYDSGDTFGDDSPHSSWVNRSDGKITWYDGPGYITLYVSSYNPDGVWYNLRFLAKVTGTDGNSCWKKFDIKYAANSSGIVSIAPSLSIIDGGNPASPNPPMSGVPCEGGKPGKYKNCE